MNADGQLASVTGFSAGVTIVEASLRGRAMLSGTECRYGDVIRPDDLVLADFDHRTVHTGGGLHLLVLIKDGEVTWRGCRRLMRMPRGIEIDDTGCGDRRTIPDLPEGWQVVGIVEKVYRPV